jgi:hypothetical protein
VAAVLLLLLLEEVVVRVVVVYCGRLFQRGTVVGAAAVV